MRTGNEARVGAVVIAALVLGVGGVIYLQGVGLRPETYYAQLEGGSGILPGAEVRVQGVRVGVVQSIALNAEQQPVATIAVTHQTPPVRLLKSYRYSTAANGLVGENYIDVKGQFQANAPAYAMNNAGDPIKVGANAGVLGGLSDDAGLLIKDLRTTLTKFNTTVEKLNNGVLSAKTQTKLANALDGVTNLTNSTTKLTQRIGSGFGPNGIRVGFGDPQAQRDLNRTLNNTALAAQDARQVMQQAGAAAREATYTARNLRQAAASLSGPEIRSILTKLNQTSTNVEGLTQSLDFTFRKGGFTQNAQVAFQSFRRAAENVEAATAGFRSIAEDPNTAGSLRDTLTGLRDSVGALKATAQSLQGTLSDPAISQQIKGTLQNLNTTSATLQTTVENLRDTTQGFKNVLGDPKVQDDLKAIPAELRNTLESTSGAAERINSILGGKRRKRSEVTGPDGKPATIQTTSDERPPFGVNLTGRYFLDPADNGPRDTTGRFYGDVTANADLFNKPFRLGLSNIGDGTDLTLQAGNYIGSGALRYGLYRSKLGLGAEYNLGRFYVEGNAWDPNHRSANAYLGFRLTPNIAIMAGRENINNRRTNSVAVRLGR